MVENGIDAGIRVVVIDDHPIVAAGLTASGGPLRLVGHFSAVEPFLAAPDAGQEVVVLDLQLHPGRGRGMEGTAAIAAIESAGRGPVVVYTALADDMIIAACIVAGARGAVTKSSPMSMLAEVCDHSRRGQLWVDPAVAGAMLRLADGRHAGVLSEQQAHALQWRAQGLKQQTIAERIGVQDEATVQRYLASAVQKLAVVGESDDSPDAHPGSRADRLARRTGLANGLVRWADLRPRGRGRR